MSDITIRRRIAIQMASEKLGPAIEFDLLPAGVQAEYDAGAVRMINAIATHHEARIIESDRGPYLLLPMWTL